MLTDNLIGRVALDSSSTLIPGQDVAIGVENENGVVSYGLDEETEKIGILAGRFRRTGGFGLGSLTDENRR